MVITSPFVDLGSSMVNDISECIEMQPEFLPPMHGSDVQQSIDGRNTFAL